MLNVTEVRCPRCAMEPGRECVNYLKGGRVENRKSGPHLERKLSAEVAPDPDLTDCKDPELLFRCSACSAAPGERCGAITPYPVGSYHNPRSRAAAQGLLLLRALPLHRTDWRSLSDLALDLPELSESIFRSTLNNLTELHLAMSDGGRPARWGLTLEGVRACREHPEPSDAVGLDDLPEGVQAFDLSETSPGELHQAIAAAVGEGEGEQPICSGYEQVPCSACGALCSRTFGVFPTPDAEEEATICPLCADLPLEEILELISQREAKGGGKTCAEWEAEQGAEGEGECLHSEATDDGKACAGCGAELVPVVTEGEGEGVPAEPPYRRTYQLGVDTTLPNEEVARLAVEMVDLETHFDSWCTDVSETKKMKKKAIDSLRQQIKDRTKTEYVEVAKTLDLATNHLRVVRLDTGEILEDRAMTAEERQDEENRRARVRKVEAEQREACRQTSMFDALAVEPAPPHGALEVACPTCSAPAGAPCLDARGTVLESPHSARVEAALAALAKVGELAKVCPLDDDCAEWVEGRCALPEGESCPDCPCGDCPDGHDHAAGCPCPEAVRAKAKENALPCGRAEREDDCPDCGGCMQNPLLDKGEGATPDEGDPLADEDDGLPF